MKASLVVLLALASAFAFAALPPAPPAAQEQASEAKAKAAWTDKVAAYQLCKSQDRVVETYRKSHTSDKPASAPAQMPPCVDPGPYKPGSNAK